MSFRAFDSNNKGHATFDDMCSLLKEAAPVLLPGKTTNAESIKAFVSQRAYQTTLDNIYS